MNNFKIFCVQLLLTHKIVSLLDGGAEMKFEALLLFELRELLCFLY